MYFLHFILGDWCVLHHCMLLLIAGFNCHILEMRFLYLSSLSIHLSSTKKYN